MQYRIKTKAKMTWLNPGSVNQQSKIVSINVTLSFPHDPTDEEIRNAIENLPEYKNSILQFKDIFHRTPIPDHM